ncbi:hypothetical protein IU501_01270 [Nocardia otitidiscaviarum]|uniref:hypothetical protein n=1 Tax=Nocardia otitidiscaviarum TaxID=1823 RepID=UPI00069403B4|nr:hypothetical protein [Nocardia otitidiscaviarum]MBF6131634.1 hypothetical protein [Nocardia otitidiscaviarum]MBF6482766.1 hypothetical protein [Nocardia otitidiscaviarum]
MFESCRSPHESAHLLRVRYGFPVELFADRPYLTVGRAVEAIGLPQRLGRHVRDQLAGLPATPAVADPRGRNWWFLVAPPTPYHAVPQRLLGRLRAHGVTVPAAGGKVMLPVSDYRLGWHWACEPEPGRLSLPHRAMVLNAARSAILRGADHVPA